jgi:uncharacterized metal-binding protein YceD (DUF177 family)
MKTPYTVKISPEEHLALAKRFGFVSLDNFELSYTVTHLGGKTIDYKVVAEMRASLIQSCSVTLKDVPEEIDDTFSFRVVHPNQEKDFEHELAEFEDFEFSSDGIIDLGEIGAQYLSLSVDPYPRFNPDDVPKIEVKKNPFSVLEQLKKK